MEIAAQRRAIQNRADAMTPTLRPCRCGKPGSEVKVVENRMLAVWEVRCSRCPTMTWDDTPEAVTERWNAAQQKLGECP